jgi:hypothetical protein
VQQRLSAAEPLSARNGIFGCGDGATEIAARDNIRPQRQKNPKPVAQIPAQTAYLNLRGKYPVRRDWVVETVDIELAAHHAVIETSLH